MKWFTVLLVFIASMFYALTSFAKQPVVIDSDTKIYTLHGPWYYILEEDSLKNRQPNKWTLVDDQIIVPQKKSKTATQNKIRYKIPFIITHNDQYMCMLSNYYPGISMYLNGKKIHEIKEPFPNNPAPDKIRNSQLIPLPCGLLQIGTNILTIHTTELNTISMLKNNFKMGFREIINKNWLSTFLWDSGFIIICFFLSFYFLFFFLTRRRESFYLYFSILAFFLGLWALSYKGIYFFLFDNIHAYIIFRYLGSIFCVYFSIIFIISFLQFERGLDILVFKIIYLFLSLFIIIELLFTGNILYFKKYARTPFMLSSILVIIYAYFLCVKGILERKNFAKILFIGIIIFSLFILLMILGFFKLIPENSYVLEGFFSLTIFFTIALASRYTRIHSELEKINNDLLILDKQKDFILTKLNRYKHIVATSRDHMAFIDPDLQLLAVNDSLLEAFAATRSSVINKSIDVIYGKNEFSAELFEHCKICLSGKETFFEKEHFFPSYGNRYMITNLTPYYEKNSPTINGIVLNSRDITERISFEKKIVNLALEERRKIGMQLHDDISQILAGVKLKLSVLSEKMQEECPTFAKKSIEIESHIEKSIIATRNIAKGLFPINIDRTGLGSYADEFQLLVDKHAITLDINIDDSILIKNIMITMHLYYIILESITNSIKHAQASHISVDFYREKEFVILSIKDNGIGLDKSIYEKNGIGLNIIKYRTRLIGGSCSIETIPTGGVHIYCRFIM